MLRNMFSNKLLDFILCIIDNPVDGDAQLYGDIGDLGA